MTDIVPEASPARTGGLVLFDGSALAYRAHFAMSRSGLSKDGMPTGAVFGFASDLWRLLKLLAPSHAAVVFDTKEPTFRHKLYDQYKATRQKMPDELVAQLDLIRRSAEALGAPVVMLAGYEADDLIGTLARRAARSGIPSVIVTGDKDFLQLVDDKIRVFRLARGGEDAVMIDAAGVVERFGVPPERVVDVLSLMGDASDNAPGVPGVGEKGAIKLVRDFGGLDAVLERGPLEAAPKLRAALKEHRELALVTRRLVTIDCDAPSPVDVPALLYGGPDRPSASALFGSLEFKALASEFAVAKERPPRDYRIVRDEAGLAALLARLSASELTAVDTETTSLDPIKAALVGVSFSTASGEADYVPMAADPPVLADAADAPFRGAAIVARLRPFLEDPRPSKCGQNSKYDMLVLRRHGVRMAGLRTDTMLASYLLDPGRREHNLDALALRHFEYVKIPTKDLIGSGKSEITMDMVPVELVAEYAAEDADFTRRLADLFLPELDAQGLRALHDQVEIPLVSVLADMEETGVRVDRKLLRNLAAEYAEAAERRCAEIRKLAGEDFNPASPKQLGELLFEKLKVHEAVGYKPRRTKTGWATGAEVLDELGDHPLVRQITEFREFSRLVSTYVLPLPECVAEDGRIHTSYNQAVAATGRLSSSDPNLQNIPIRTEAGKRIRGAFLASSDDHELLSADYSQIELRLLAHFCEDEALGAAFREGRDIHRETAARVFGLEPDKVDSAARGRAKAVNFGILYGMGPMRLARETELGLEEAKEFIEKYFAAFPKVRGYLDGLKDEARRTGRVTTILGRRRAIPDINSPNGMLRSQAENMAVNTPIQGSAADLIKVAMIRIAADLERRRLKTRLILQVHDELVLDGPRAEMDEVATLVRDGMENVAPLKVPLRADIGRGRTWLEAH